jgi:uncharacterized membrane protein YcaP (DUF421 family)
MSHVVIRTLAVYLFLLVVFRLAGKRTLAQTDTFDFVIILIIGEATQEALVGDDFSLTTCFLVITTLLGVGIALAYLKQVWPRFERVLDGGPVILIEEGRMHKDRMDKLRIDEEDILEAAQLQHGIGRLEQVRYAILERNGDIAVVGDHEAP